MEKGSNKIQRHVCDEVAISGEASDGTVIDVKESTRSIAMVVLLISIVHVCLTESGQMYDA